MGVFRIWTLLAVIIFLAAACAPAAGLPVQSTPSATPHPERPTAPPTFTAAPFILQPTGTPAATPTSLPFGIAGTILPAQAPGGLPTDVNPLSGQRVSDPDRLERRPLIVKITNFPRSVRPQWGLNTADHVWEYYLEDELTRFVGIYYGRDAERVGPVRSARPFDEHLLRMYKGILTFGYADKRLMDQWMADPGIRPFMVIQKPDNCPPMCRIGGEDSYNNLFTNTAELSRYVEVRGTSNSRQDLEGPRFEAEGLAAAGGDPADQVRIRFSPESYHYWEYQPVSGRYLRWQDRYRKPAGEEVYQPLLDRLDGSQVSADNLVLLMVPSDYIYVSTSTDVIQHQLAGSGPGYGIRDGRLFPITWHRERPHDLIRLLLPSGRPYLLKPGNVWFEVLSAETPATVEDGRWQFLYSVPPVPTITPHATATP